MVHMGGERGGPHGLVSCKTLPPHDTSRACVWKDHLRMTLQKCTIGREGWVFKFPDQL